MLNFSRIVLWRALEDHHVSKKKTIIQITPKGFDFLNKSSDSLDRSIRKKFECSRLTFLDVLIKDIDRSSFNVFFSNIF